MLAALAERDIADAEMLSALGKFDLTLRAKVETDQFGFYRNERIVTGFDQPMQWWGSSFYGGWRVGDGAFAPYDGKLDTRSYGEWSGGMKLPLWRDRGIDSKRAGLRQAGIGRALARLSIAQQRLLIVQLATRRYWDWTAAGTRLQVAEGVLDIALKRDRFLRDSAAAGQIAAIEVIENERAILQRRSAVVETDRLLQQTAIDLSLFLRDSRGEPVLTGRNRLPGAFPEANTVDEARMLADMEVATARRPELQRLIAQERQLLIDRELALNDRKPEIDFNFGFTAENGRGAVRRGPQEVKAGVVFELPFQRRSATGKLQSTDAKLRQIDQRERFTRDQILAEVRDAASAVRAAHDRVGLLRREVAVSRDLEDAERARFQLGEGTLFLVNPREQSTAEAANREVSAWQEYFRAWAQYDFAVASALGPGAPAK